MALTSWARLSAGLAIVTAACGGPPSTSSDAIDPNWLHRFADGNVDAQGILAGPDRAITIVGNAEGDSLGLSEAWIVEYDRQGEQGFRYTPRHTDGDIPKKSRSVCVAVFSCIS